MNRNIDKLTVDGFGDEWRRFKQDKLDDNERQLMYNDYFGIFPWDKLPENAVGADVGCGSGRWAMMIAPKVGHLHLVDASLEALNVARENLSKLSNCSFYNVSLDEMPFQEQSLDFAYSLGVLHHVPDTFGAINSVAMKIKPGGVFLAYIYYKFDNRPLWFRLLWRISNLIRQIVCRLPYPIRFIISQVIAIFVYWPLSRLAMVLEKLFRPFPNMPLYWYRNKSFYSLRTDALDRFGTRLEHRFTQPQIEDMLLLAGFKDIHFSDSAPFWCVSAIKK